MLANTMQKLDKVLDPKLNVKLLRCMDTHVLSNLAFESSSAPCKPEFLENKIHVNTKFPFNDVVGSNTHHARIQKVLSEGVEL